MLSMTYVVFCSATGTLARYLPKGFQHCFVVRNDYDKVWTEINGGRDFLGVTQELVEDYPTIEDYCALLDDVTIVKTERQEGKGQSFGMVNCVSIVKYYLAINKPFILTPKHLHRFLTCRPY